MGNPTQGKTLEMVSIVSQPAEYIADPVTPYAGYPIKAKWKMSYHCVWPACAHYLPYANRDKIHIDTS